jgi:hypothetical protein
MFERIMEEGYFLKVSSKTRCLYNKVGFQWGFFVSCGSQKISATRWRSNQVTAVRAANARWHPTAIICTRDGAAPTWSLFAMFQKNVIVVVGCVGVSQPEAGHILFWGYYILSISMLLFRVSIIRIFIRIFFLENYSLFEYFLTEYSNNNFYLINHIYISSAPYIYHLHSRRCCPHLVAFCDVSKKCYGPSRVKPRPD